MPENASVGGVSGGGWNAGSSNAAGSGNNSDNSSSSATESSNNSSSSSSTTGDSLANSPTTADSLAGGKAAQSDDSSSNSNSTSNADTPPAAGTGSLDAAVSHSQNTAAAAQASKEQQQSTTPDTPAPTFSDNSTAANPNLGVQTNESKTSEASIAGSITEGAVNLAKDQVDRTGRAAAATTLTRGNAGNLPASGYANRAELAKTITNPSTTAAKALEATPYGPKALSSQQLSNAANNAKGLGRAAGVIGTVAGPIVGAYEGYQAAPQQSTTGERIANMIGGGLKEVDDSLVSAGAGFAAGAGTVIAAGALAAGGVTAPAAPAVAASAPAVATAAAIGASTYYDGKTVDNVIDNAVDNYVEPAIAAAADTAINAYEAAGSWFGGISDRVKSWF